MTNANPWGSSTEWWYYKTGELKSVSTDILEPQDPAAGGGTYSSANHTRKEYYKTGQLKAERIIHPDGSVVIKDYDETGQLESEEITNPDGSETIVYPEQN